MRRIVVIAFLAAVLVSCTAIDRQCPPCAIAKVLRAALILADPADHAAIQAEIRLADAACQACLATFVPKSPTVVQWAEDLVETARAPEAPVAAWIQDLVPHLIREAYAANRAKYASCGRSYIPGSTCLVGQRHPDWTYAEAEEQGEQNWLALQIVRARPQLICRRSTRGAGGPRGVRLVIRGALSLDVYALQLDKPDLLERLRGEMPRCPR